MYDKEEELGLFLNIASRSNTIIKAEIYNSHIEFRRKSSLPLAEGFANCYLYLKIKEKESTKANNQQRIQ